MSKLLSLTLLLLLPAMGLFAQTEKKVRKSPHDTVVANNMKVTYGRPYKKGRDIFGALEPYGKVWRAGADEATEITFMKDGTFGGKKIKAGTYTLFTIPEKDKWTIILNSELKQWGAYGYDKIKSKDVLTTTVPAKQLNTEVEQLTIKLASDAVVLEWDRTSVSVPVKF